MQLLLRHLEAGAEALQGEGGGRALHARQDFHFGAGTGPSLLLLFESKHKIRSLLSLNTQHILPTVSYYNNTCKVGPTT